MRFSSTLLIIAAVILFLSAGYVISTFSLHRSFLPNTEKKPMRIARTYWPGEYWIDIADEKGWFAEEGLAVETIDTNSDFTASLQAVVDGELDTQDFWLYDLMHFNASGAELVMVINTDRSAGSEGIVAMNGIETIQDLKGKRIGVESNLATGYLLHTVLKQNNISTQEVTIINSIGSEELPEALKAGTVDAIVVWEPHLSQALEVEGSNKIWDTSKLPGIISAGSTFRKSFIEERPDDVRAFVRVWHRSTKFIEQNPQEAYDIVSKRYGDTLENAESYTTVNNILTLRDNLKSFSQATGFTSLPGQAKYINQYFLETGLLTDELHHTTFLDDRFIKELNP